MSVHYSDSTVTVHHGDCLEVMAGMPENSVDAIVTDPPYGLGFMGKKWDGLPPSLEWAEACYRVLKPGGHIAAFGGTRTWHRLAVAIEDAGFEMRDSLAWLYGSGFPKSLDMSKAIDKHAEGDMRRAKLAHFVAQRGVDAKWLQAQGVADSKSFTDWTVEGHAPSNRNWALIRDALEVTPDEEAEFERKVIGSKRRAATGRMNQGEGGYAFGEDFDITSAATPEAERWQGWGTALKPAFEPIVLARKPLAEKTVARNVLAHGTGAINVDACRIATDEDTGRAQGSDIRGGNWVSSTRKSSYVSVGSPDGRWPANVLLDHHAAAWVDEQSGVQRDGVAVNRNKNPDIEKPHTVYGGGWMNGDRPDITYGGGGGASRFFYSAKAPKSERPNVDGVQHPTVKPLAIMRWLIRLVTPPGGTVLDPFAGSGTTIEAAQHAGHRAIGIELTDEYLPLIIHRLERADSPEEAPTPPEKAPMPPEVDPDQLDMLSMLDGTA